MSKFTQSIKSRVSASLEKSHLEAKEKCLQADSLMHKALKSENNSPLVQKALDLYTEASKLAPRMVDPYLGIAYIAYSLGDLNQAIGLLNKANKLEPNESRIVRMLEELSSEYSKNKLSGVISKQSGKSLSEKLASRNNIFSPNRIWEKISSIFFSSPKSKSSKKTKNSQSIDLLGNASSKELSSNSPKPLEAVNIESDNKSWFQQLNQARKQKK